MAMTLAEKQDLLGKVERAYFSGLLSVQNDGERITYQSSDQMWAAIQRLRAEANGTKRRAIGVRF